MDIKRAFTYIREDKEWIVNIVLGGFIVLLPVAGFIGLLGYMLEIAANVAQGNPRPLPTWKDFSRLARKGLDALIIALVYYGPLILLVCIIMGISAFNQGGAGLAFVLSLLLLVGGLCLSVLVYAGWIRYIQTGDQRAALRPGELLAIVRSSPQPFGMLLAVALLCILGASLGLLPFAIALPFTIFYAHVVFGHALGQVAAQVPLTGGSEAAPGMDAPAG